MFDLYTYLASKGGRASHGTSGPQMMIACPWCRRFGGFYVALEEHTVSRPGEAPKTYPPGTYVCFKCGKKSSVFTFLYAELEGVSYSEARGDLAKQRVGHLGRFIPKPPPKPPPPPEIEATTNPIHPEGFNACWDPERRVFRMPAYLKDRKITKDTARSYGLGWVDSGMYAGRIICPVVCPLGSSFQARSMDPEDKMRFLSGPGAGRLLFGWPQAEDAATLVICEGPFDVMSVYQAALGTPGIGAVGILGKRLRGEQIRMIRTHKATSVVLMLDGDALDDALEQHQQLGRRVKVAGLLDPTLPSDHPDQLDAGDCAKMNEPQRILAALQQCRPPEVVRIARMREKVQRLVTQRAAR